uniref:Rho-GAP domain-containing protein n=3 Tax=Octopus bimaculoides TaxID=37653 RepID=A0A0L8FMF3_OCTBM
MVAFTSLQSYDVADLTKQYFRELPECLLTNKLSETFIGIFTHFPKEHWLEAVNATIILMPDENREVLQSLLLFLHDISKTADHHKATTIHTFQMMGQQTHCVLYVPRSTTNSSQKPRCSLQGLSSQSNQISRLLPRMQDSSLCQKKINMLD